MWLGLQREKDRKKLKMRIYDKLMLSYLVIVLMSLLCLYISTAVINSKMVKAQEIEHNRAMLSSIKENYYQQCYDIKKSIMNLYISSSISNIKEKTWSILEGKEMDALTYKDAKTSMLSFLDETCINSGNNLAASIVVLDGQKIITKTNNTVSLVSYDSYILNKIGTDEGIFGDKKRIYYIGTFRGNQTLISMLYYKIVSRTNVNETIGYLVCTYDPTLIKNYYQAYNKTKIGEILLLSGEGDVIFDSTEDLYGSTYENMDFINRNKNTIIEKENITYDIIYDEDFDFYVVGIITDENFASVTRTSNVIMVIAMLTFSFFAFIYSLVMSKGLTMRTTKLINTMDRVKKGDLTARAHLTGNDEIYDLGEYFDEACDAINNHIEKEYLYQMKQKEAEIYALQTQIDPHFLFNSLESIRMRAVRNHDEDVSLMVRYLADMFRQNIKGEMILSLSQEIESCNSFIEFNNIRYDYCLDIDNQIPTAMLSSGVFRFMIQPILENIVVHGMDTKKDNILIKLDGKKEDNNMYIIISDDGVGIKKEVLQDIKRSLCDFSINTKKYMGLRNVNERIKLIYGQDYGLTIDSEENQGTVVTIKIMYREVEELKRDVQCSFGG